MYSPYRKLIPALDVRGRVTHWRCATCHWTHVLTAAFTGFQPGPTVIQSFTDHECGRHLSNTTEVSQEGYHFSS